MDGPAAEARIYRAALGSDLMMIGAAELAFAQFLADPASAGPLPAAPVSAAARSGAPASK
jgi:hypothetical protein